MEPPILIPGLPRAWPCQKWTFQSLAELLNDKEFSCRIWKKSKAQVFETNCDHMNINLNHFVDWLEAKPSSDNPLFPYARTDYNCYIDYKYMKDMFASVPEVFDDVRWRDFGLTDFNGSDSTIWIGSEGSNTPCHQDSYGFNLVTQIQGRKMWILFPPSDAANLYSTRIPYEESSVFSQVDVKNPDLHEHPCFQQSHPIVVVLKPGQSLYVPNLWWHYVESLEPSISINVWVPLKEDKYQHLNEAITRCLATCLIGNLDSDEDCDLKSQLLNPTEDLFSSKMNQMCLKSALDSVICSDLNEGNKRENIERRNLNNGEDDDDYNQEEKNASSLDRHDNDSNFEKFERWIQNYCEVVQDASLSSYSPQKRSSSDISPHTNKKYKGDLESQVRYQKSGFSSINNKTFHDHGDLTVSQENARQREENDGVETERQYSYDQIKTGSDSFDSSDSHKLKEKKESHAEISHHSPFSSSCDISMTEGSYHTQRHRIYHLMSLPFNEYLSVISDIFHNEMKGLSQNSSSDFVMGKCLNETIFPLCDKESGFSMPSIQVTQRNSPENSCDEDSMASDSSTQQLQAHSQDVAHGQETLSTESEFMKTFIASVLHPDVVSQISLVLRENHLRKRKKEK